MVRTCPLALTHTNPALKLNPTNSCWLTAGHPDPHGEQIKLLTEKLSRLYGGRGLLHACRSYGFRDMGVFLDWASLFQKDPDLFVAHWKMPDTQETKDALEAYESSRPPDQKASFDRALKGTMDLWYGHSGTTVIMLTELPEGWNTKQLTNGARARAPPIPGPAVPARPNGYDRSGWPTFERCSAELGKSFHLNGAKWNLVIDTARPDGGATRRLPTIPTRMKKLLDQEDEHGRPVRQFTNGADKETVQKLYKKTAQAILHGKRTFDFSQMSLTCENEAEEDMRKEDSVFWRSPVRLAETLNRCPQLEKLYLAASRLTDAGMKAIAGSLAEQSLPALKELDVSANRFGAAGIKALGDKLAGGGVAVKLGRLDMLFSELGDEGIKSIAYALAAGAAPNLSALNLTGNLATDEGAAVLAAARVNERVECRVGFLGSAHVTTAGRAMLILALQAVHGPEFGHPFSTSNCSGPKVVRALVRGYRAVLEDDLGKQEKHRGLGEAPQLTLRGFFGAAVKRARSTLRLHGTTRPSIGDEPVQQELTCRVQIHTPQPALESSFDTYSVVTRPGDFVLRSSRDDEHA